MKISYTLGVLWRQEFLRNSLSLRADVTGSKVLWTPVSLEDIEEILWKRCQGVYERIVCENIYPRFISRDETKTLFFSQKLSLDFSIHPVWLLDRENRLKQYQSRTQRFGPAQLQGPIRAV